MAKRKPRQIAVDAADKAMSLYIRTRDGRCITCGSTEGLTNSHLITRGKFATRWDESNCYCQCRGCNFRHEHQPEIFTDWWIKQNGIEAYHALVLKSNTPRKFPIFEIREITEYYKNKLKELEQ